MQTLFNPKYTIDTSALLTLMNPGEKYDRSAFKRLWNDICGLCTLGKMVSHIEVQKEIRAGGIKPQVSWIKSYKDIFLNYDLPAEGQIIRNIGSRGGYFVTFLQQGKLAAAHADPWLVAQAKINGFILVSEEAVNSPKKIPAICSAFGVKSMTLLDLIKEEKWIY